MTLVKSDIPELLTAGLKTAFFQSFGETPAQWDKVATVIPSERDTEQYAWLGALPGMREFRDERQPGDPKPYSYAIQNKTWESTISVDRTALEDDQYGQIAMRIRQMAGVAKLHLDSIVFGLLGTGFTAEGYDGVPFFGTHNQGAAQSNKGADALAATVLAGGDHSDDALSGRPGPADGDTTERFGGPAGTVLGGDGAADFFPVPGPDHNGQPGPGRQPPARDADAADDAVPDFADELVPAGHVAGGARHRPANAEGVRVRVAGRQLGERVPAGSVPVRGAGALQCRLRRLAGGVRGAGGVISPGPEGPG